MKGRHMRVAAMVSAAKPIIRICDLDQDHPEYAEIEFETQADANAAVTQLKSVQHPRPGHCGARARKTSRQ